MLQWADYNTALWLIDVGTESECIMHLSDLIARCGFTDPKPVKKHLEWKSPDGNTYDFDVFIVR